MEKQILENLLKEGLSTYKIAKILKKGQTTIRYWINKHSLQTNSFHQDINTLQRKCYKCKEIKSKDDFYNRNEKRKQSYCKGCFNRIIMNRWLERKQKAILYKGNKCFDCNNQFPYPIYDFHHLDPSQKDYDWSKLKLQSWTTIIKELDKCILLCSNCHRLRHYKETLEGIKPS